MKGLKLAELVAAKSNENYSEIIPAAEKPKEIPVLTDADRSGGTMIQRELDQADAEVRRAERLLEVAHVAHRLSVSQEYVRRLVRRGKLPSIRLDGRIRIDPRDLQAFINQRRMQRDATGCNETQPPQRVPPSGVAVVVHHVPDSSARDP